MRAVLQMFHGHLEAGYTALQSGLVGKGIYREELLFEVWNIGEKEVCEHFYIFSYFSNQREHYKSVNGSKGMVGYNNQRTALGNVIQICRIVATLYVQVGN